jgi:hypothetical protein
MTFRLVDGIGAREGPRWIAASGAITGDTPAAFEAFQRDNDITGLTIYLDSFGGRVLSGLRLGRAFRAAGLATSVGRTAEDGIFPDGRPRHVLLTHGVACNSACVYALMGGEIRELSRSVRLGVHQFSGRLSVDNRAVDSSFGRDEFRFAQRRMADIAVYMQEMGIDLRLLSIISETPYGEPLRYLQRNETVENRLASVRPMPREDALSYGWLTTDRPDDPWLARRALRTGPDGRRIDDDINLRCGNRTSTVISLRQTLVAPGTSGEPLAWGRIRFSAGTAEHTWRRPAQGGPGALRAPGSAIWMFTTAPLALVEQMAVTGTLAVAIAPEADAAFGPSFQLGDERLTAAARRFLQACRSRPTAARANSDDGER